MNIQSFVFLAVAMILVWLLGKRLWKRGEKREIVFVAISVVWSFYLIAGAGEAWPALTPLTGVQLLMEPLGRFIQFHEWNG